MQVYWAEFTPVLSLLGGMVIGVAASLLMLANGRVMGMRRIFGSLLGKAETKNWRLAFIAGSFLAIMFVGLKLGPVLKVKL